jgi:small subunit ribosomal protein S16
MLRIRLRRTGAKKQPRYRVVVADVRAPRDGAFVDSIGYYDPLTEPSTIQIDRDRALDWMAKGAQPSDRVQWLMRKAGIVEGPEPVYPERKKKKSEPEAARAAAPAAAATAAPAPAAAPAATAVAEPEPAAVEAEPVAEAAEPAAEPEATAADEDGTEPAK